MIGFGFEAFVFAYLGLSFFAYVDTEHWTYPWSWNFILVELFICLVARFMGTVGLITLMRLFGHKPQVTFKQLLFICYAGLIRGAIAFGLVLKLDESLVPDENSRNVITTTALTLVISTTIVFGGCMPLVQNALVPAVDSEKTEYDNPDIEEVDEEEEESHLGEEDKINASKEKKTSVDTRHSKYEEFLHPNAMRDSEYNKSPDA